MLNSARTWRASSVRNRCTAESTGRFGVMVWGLDSCSSYAYPAGGSVAPINTVIVPPTPK